MLSNDSFTKDWKAGFTPLQSAELSAGRVMPRSVGVPQSRALLNSVYCSGKLITQEENKLFKIFDCRRQSTKFGSSMTPITNALLNPLNDMHSSLPKVRDVTVVVGVVVTDVVTVDVAVVGAALGDTD